MDSKWLLSAIVLATVQIAVTQTNRCENLPDGRFINDFTACDGFFTCFRGEPFPGTCPEGYFFNEEEQLCDFDWRVKCLLCPDDPAAPPTLEPIEGNCEFYALCFQGIGSLRECADGTLFDRVLGACAVADTVDCEASVCPSNINPETPVLVPDPADCSSYFICLRGEATPAQCAPTLLFNPETRRCDLEENVECIEGAPSPTSCPATGLHLIGNPADCVSYFVCLDGVQSDSPINCAPNLIFDKTTAQCQLPDENSECADGSSPLPDPVALKVATA
ncbi:peritrophin-1-like [Anopheles aquasalis]|uniref:peritrophin-1-like n=1 Tax=Anopheles aquasalis TaxID=42839 RepID=UPI00215A3821|nr:peritrophin-1-like [Anopheles aquasalis]